MLLHNLIEYINQQLAQCKSPFPYSPQSAWWILEALTQKSATALLAHEEIDLTALEKALLENWVYQITVEHKPLAYVLGTIPFGPLNLFIEPPTLIPRPETEEWIFYLIKKIRSSQKIPSTILDIGTGSGCIALLLAHTFYDAKIMGIDISEKAIDLAQKNAAHHKISHASFLHADIFKQNLKFSPHPFDLIVSNPPYVSNEEWEQLEPSVKNWEDPMALKAEHHGLAIIEKIITIAPSLLTSEGQLALEIGYRQGELVKALFKENGFHCIEIWHDIQKNERMVIGRR